MSAIASTPTDAAAKNAPTSGRLFFLDLGAGRILSADRDGSDLKTIINEGRKLPDGLVLDVAAVENNDQASYWCLAGLGMALCAVCCGMAIAYSLFLLGADRPVNAQNLRS